MTQTPELQQTSRRSAAPAGAAPTKPTKAPKVRTQEAPYPSGGPRVDLLPPIVEARRKQNATLRLLMLGLVGIAAIAVVASIAVWVLATVAERGLADERARTATLLQQQNTFTDVIAVKAQLGDYDEARMAALYSDTDWARIMRQFDAALPAGVAIRSESITVKGLSTENAAGVDAEGAVSIDIPGVVEIVFSATAPTFDSPTPLLNGFTGITGYVSANVSAVSNTGAEGYTITGAVQLDARALGGTARTGTLDADDLKALQDALMAAATAPPAAVATTQGADRSTAENTTSTEGQ